MTYGFPHKTKNLAPADGLSEGWTGGAGNQHPGKQAWKYNKD